MKILITGTNGLLGQKLIYLLKNSNGVSVIACARGANRINDKNGYIYETVDLTDAGHVTEIIAKHRPDCIIHSAAMTNVDQCELDPEACRTNNIATVKYLTAAARDFGSHFIYISTDFVFNGISGPYKETDPIDPLSVYARSKAEAEDLVMKCGLPWTIMRTMIIYGVCDDAQRSNVVLWTKKSLESGTDIKVIHDQFRGPTLAEDLAEACKTAALKKVQGLFHVSGREVMSILEIAYQVADFFELDKKHIHPISTAALNQPARRPLKTGFIISKAERELNYHPHSLLEGLKIVKEQLLKKQVS